MSKYIKIPHGQEPPHKLNDAVLIASINAIGRHRKIIIPSVNSDENRGRFYLHNTLGCSRREIKLLHTVYDNGNALMYGNNYSHYKKISREKTAVILAEILSYIHNDLPERLLVDEAEKVGLDTNKREVELLFGETLYWLERASRDPDNLEDFNKHNVRREEAESIRQSVLHIDE